MTRTIKLTFCAWLLGTVALLAGMALIPRPWWLLAYVPLAGMLARVIYETAHSFPFSVWSGPEYPYGTLYHCFPSLAEAERQARRLQARQGGHVYIRGPREEAMT